MLLCAAADSCVPVSHRKLLILWQPRYNSIRISGICFVTATNGASVCSCVRILWACHPEQRGTIPTHTCSEFQKHPRSDSSGTIPVYLATLTYMRTPLFPLFNLRQPRDFKPTTSRRGTLYEAPYTEYCCAVQ